MPKLQSRARMPAKAALARSLLFVAGAAVIGTAALADRKPSKEERNRQISEVVFKNYPPRALANGEQGSVYFVVSLDKDAHATSCQVTHTSGHPLLDEETCDLIVQNAVFQSAKDADGHVTKASVEGVVNWHIPGAAPLPVAPPVAVVASNAPEKRICKRTLRTGTLAGYERTCMTASEWDRATAASKQPWEEFQKSGHSCNDNVCPTDPGVGH